MTYSEAYQQLQVIIEEIENEQIEIDELTKKINHASELITYYKIMITIPKKKLNVFQKI